MTFETHRHCQCDFCSGVDCGQDDPEAYEQSQKEEREAIRAEERKKTLDELRKHLIKISDSGACPTGWEPTDKNRACENDTCAICIFDKAVDALKGESK